MALISIFWLLLSVCALSYVLYLLRVQGKDTFNALRMQVLLEKMMVRKIIKWKNQKRVEQEKRNREIENATDPNTADTTETTEQNAQLETGDGSVGHETH